jgi:acetylornithine/N-succinyldiaminopimelate aminotransferase
MDDYLFGYGTLRPAVLPRDLVEIVEGWSRIGRASIRGRLFDLGEYPGAILDSHAETAIIGEVFKLPDGKDLLAELDNYESFNRDDPEASLFIRTRCKVTMDNSSELECWIYVFNQEITSAKLIENGDYLSIMTTMEAQAKHRESSGSSLTLSQTQQLESQYLMQTYARSPVLFVRGKGSTLFDDQGKAYLDFIAGIGVNVLGYDHPRVRRVLREQGSLLHTSNLYYHSYQGQLAERLAKAAGMSRVFFCNTGTESVEGALKLARAWQRTQGREDKTEFVALVNSFHGRTMGALSITEQEKYRKPFEPLIPGARFIDPRHNHNDFAEAREVINERTAAVIIETIQGESGVRPVDEDFLKAVRDACDKAGALLILDEVQCGLGRTGKIFAFENTSVKPDVLCVAKPLGLGVPLGAFIVGEKAGDGLKAGDHGTTFGGGPLACRLSLEFMGMLQEEQLMRRILQVGNYFRKQLRQMQRRHPELIKEIRGLGLMIGVEMSFPSKSVVTKMLERGFVINCTHDTVLRFLPPYIIKKTEISSMLTNLEEVIVSEAPT